MKFKLIPLALVASIIMNSCGSDTHTDLGSELQSSVSDIQEEPMSEEELKQELFDVECSNSSTYLSGSVSYKPIYKGLLSSKVKGIKLEINLTSSATLATIKDIGIELNFTAKTGASVLREEIMIYEFIEPGSSIRSRNEISVTNQEWQDITDVELTVSTSSCE
jgi:hypothetical protein